jgi:hypothetical protein
VLEGKWLTALQAAAEKGVGVFRSLLGVLSFVGGLSCEPIGLHDRPSTTFEGLISHASSNFSRVLCLLPLT